MPDLRSDLLALLAWAAAGCHPDLIDGANE
jgi:hypothetical protein